MKKTKKSVDAYKKMKEQISPKKDYFKPFKTSLQKGETEKKFKIRMLPTYEDQFIMFGEEQMNMAVIARKYWDMKIFRTPVISKNSYFITGQADINDEVVEGIWESYNQAKDADDKAGTQIFKEALPKDSYYSVVMVNDEVVIWEYPNGIFEKINEVNQQLVDDAKEGDDVYFINDLKHGRDINVSVKRNEAGMWGYNIILSVNENEAFPGKTDDEIYEILKNVPKISESMEIVDDEYLSSKLINFITGVVGEENIKSETKSDNDDGKTMDDPREKKEDVKEEKTTMSALDKLRNMGK